MAYKVKMTARFGKKKEVKERLFLTKREAEKMAKRIREATLDVKKQYPKTPIGKAKIRTTISKVK